MQNYSPNPFVQPKAWWNPNISLGFIICNCQQHCDKEPQALHDLYLRRRQEAMCVWIRSALHEPRWIASMHFCDHWSFVALSCLGFILYLADAKTYHPPERYAKALLYGNEPPHELQFNWEEMGKRNCITKVMIPKPKVATACLKYPHNIWRWPIKEPT